MSPAVPPMLADPPWLARRAAAPVVLAGLSCADPATMEWAAGERAEWLAQRADDPLHRSWDMLIHRVQCDVASWDEQMSLFVHGPEDVVRPELAAWRPEPGLDGLYILRRVAARFEQDALPPVLYAARRRPADFGPLLVPFAAPDLARVMAELLGRKTSGGVARAWLGRHPGLAARALVPVALRKPGAARRHAEQGLLVLHDDGHAGAVRAAAAGYGDEAVAAIETLLASDRTAPMPVVPRWAAPGTLPPVEARGGGALPDEAVSHLLRMVAASRLDQPYPALKAVTADLDRAGLAALAWELFRRWDGHGADSRDGWAMHALGLLGDDDTVRRLTPLILQWPGRNHHARAVTGVSVLAAIGSDLALLHLYRISRTATYPGLKTAAGQKMDELAAALGLTVEQLADRSVPDFGLNADGSITLDYGPRRFTVGFDEQLRPYVRDAAGKHLKALPKPGVKDDPAAYQAFTTLKRDVRKVATEQLRRMERAMVKRRRWSAAEFRRHFVEHPLMLHLTRRLVWGVYDRSGAMTGAVRVAEDLSLATVDDAETTLADDAVVGIAHPLELGDRRPDWAEVLADYEILQPFPQLARQTFTPTAEEAEAGRLLRFDGAALPDGRARELEFRGWTRDQNLITFEVGAERTVVVRLGSDASLEQQILDIALTGDPRLPVTSADPVALSDVIRHLSEVTP
ncbi:DUF4132 domain-containing protein [Actinoplanes sp. NPDC049265]|uniref:DUF4132 domain-containing protein n=1 Tax=Actinoplanes sp. NPDC049265 TaxID=3363902 RepID=UPI0037127E2B